MAQSEVFLYLPTEVLKETFVLNNGNIMPKITFGVSQMMEYSTVYSAVNAALEVGYRSFDCSPEFQEEALGTALQDLLPGYNLKRCDILITSKIHPRDYGLDSTTEAFWHSCERLKTDYIDQFLMQWPGGHNMSSEDSESVNLRQDTWKELLKLRSQGLIKNPGVCNFNSKHLESIQECCDKIPVLNQVEFHPRFPQIDLLDYCKDHNIVVQACSFKETFHPLLLTDNKVTTVAKLLKKTPTQVLLKWILNKNVGVICHSEKPKTIRQNFHLFDFVLEKREMDLINSIDIRSKFLRNPLYVV